MNFARNLKALRLNGFYTQEEVAGALHISKSAYSHFERGDRRPDVEILFEISRFFGVRIDTLFSQHDQRFISDIDFYAVMTEQEKELVQHFAALSEFSKGKLIERLKVLQEEDDVLFRNFTSETEKRSHA